ncbi:hypothetical protein Glove_420g110 [Diversispora epigaea]|uniref:Uncharacterized protein n=1 Tax=Diversispora epigaea TaxID=1348612 RepID=A0A397GWA6_9GLOM|nr:hypothetical protein Glove_420g110 [Diversispora epigaea]
MNTSSAKITKASKKNFRRKLKRYAKRAEESISTLNTSNDNQNNRNNQDNKKANIFYDPNKGQSLPFEAGRKEDPTRFPPSNY